MAAARRRPRRRGGRLHGHRSAVAGAAQTHPAAHSRQHPARPRLHGSGVPVLGAPGSTGRRWAALSTAPNRHAGRKAPLACLRTRVSPLPCGVAVSDCPGPSSTSNRGEAMAMLTADDVLNKKFQATKFREGYDQEEGDRIVNEAKVQAGRIVREAEETSSRTLAQLEQERGLLERKIDELRVFERDYRTRLKSYMENLLGDLESRGSNAQPRPVGDSGLPFDA